MAVIQISKIQQRRGQKLLSGIPQLSSGELAWAVDTQELYIGNGSLTEGAPYVGNTKILTEHDNILELANSYRFANDDINIVYSVPRTLQDKLDEIEVSILDYGQGDLADGSTDCTLAFKTAFEELFQNTDEKYRKVLKIPNGVYLFTQVLKIPSNVIIKGETRDGVVLDVNANGIEFLTADNLEAIDFTGSNRPENVSISNLTISYTAGETNLTGLKSSKFDNVKFISGYVLGETVSTPVRASVEYDLSAVTTGGSLSFELFNNGTSVFTEAAVFNENTVLTIQDLISVLNLNINFNATYVASITAESLRIVSLFDNVTAAEMDRDFSVSIVNISGSVTVSPERTEASSGIENTVAAVSWRNGLFDTRVTDIEFSHCLFESVDLAVKCINNPINSAGYETSIKFDRCKFYVCDTAVYVQSPSTQVNDWEFLDCYYEEVAKQVIFSTNGTGISVNRGKIKNCGNGSNDASVPLYPIFQFGKKWGNTITGIISDRHQAVLDNISSISKGIPEALNAGSISFTNDYYSPIYLSDTPFELAVFSSESRFITIDYVLTLGPEEYVRKGTLNIVMQSEGKDLGDHVAVSDSYVYSSQLVTSPGGVVMTNFEFTADLRANVTDDGDSASKVDSVFLSYVNPTSIGLEGSISYTVTYGV